MSTPDLPDISVIIFALDQGHLLNGTLLSVRRAVAAARRSDITVDVAIVIVGEHPKTREWIAEHSSMAVFDFAHLSLGQARNAAFAASRGRIVAVIDGWDIWSADFLVTGHRCIRSETAATVWRPAALLGFADDFTDFSGVQIAFTPQPGTVDDAAILVGNPYSTSFIARRGVLERVPFPLEDEARGWSEIDWWWCANITGSGIVNRPLEDTVLYFRTAARTAQASSGPRRFGPTLLERRVPSAAKE